MAFWKKKFFKNGTSKNGTDHKDDNGPYDNGHEIKYQGHKSKEDSPKNGSINSLEEAYANLPLVKKPDLTKRQMLPDQERSLTMEEAQRQQQSMIMEEAMKLQSMKSMTMEEAQQIQKLRHIQQQQPHAEGISGNVAQQQSSKKEKSKLKTNPPSDFIQHHHNHVNAFESYGNVPSWRNEKLSRSSPPSSNVSAQINGETNASYSPTWSSSDKSKGDQQIYRTPSPKSVNRNQQIDKTPSPKSTHYNQLGAMEKDKKNLCFKRFNSPSNSSKPATSSMLRGQQSMHVDRFVSMLRYECASFNSIRTSTNLPHDVGAEHIFPK